MSTIQLTADHFSRTPENLLLLNLPGNVFVMYTTDDCRYCHRYQPIYDKFSRSIRGCQFAIANASKNNQAIQRACQNTNIRLASVPHFVLFADGVPIAETTDRRDLRATAAWIKENLANYMAPGPPPQQQQQQQQQHYPPPQQQGNYPPQQEYPRGRQQDPQRRGRGGRPRGPQYSEATGVRIFKTSYGIPANSVSGEEFENYEAAYENRE